MSLILCQLDTQANQLASGADAMISENTKPACNTVFVIGRT